mgnify:CR=1 FL=1
MKRSAIPFLAGILSFSLAVCQGQKAESSEITTPSTETNILITYFTLGRNAEYEEDIDAGASASLVLDGDQLVGTTEYVAERIQDYAGGDLHLIQVTEPYPADFDAVVDQNHEEMNAGILPELAASDLDLSQYDTVFIGYPVWWGDMPMAMYSFLDEADLSGKTAVPFVTSGGSGFSNTISMIESMEARAAIQEGLSISGSSAVNAQEQVMEWLRGLGYIEA